MSDVIDLRDSDSGGDSVLTPEPVQGEPTLETEPARGESLAGTEPAGREPGLDEPRRGGPLADAEPLNDESATGGDPNQTPSLGAPTLAAALEALLLLADEPVPATNLAEITGTPVVAVETELAELSMRYVAEGRGIELRRVDTGWRYYTAESCRDLITRYVTDGRQSRLSQAALETLAIVAYRQPVTRAQVGAVRGVNSDGVLKTLVARGLITQSSADADETAAHFVTTPYFLDRMGLSSLSELPPIADHLPDLASLDELVG